MNYPLYEISSITSIKDILKNAINENRSDIAIRYFVNKKNIAVSYLDMAINTFKIARYIGRHKTASVIGIVGRNSYEWIVTFLSVTCGGHIVVALDRELSNKELCELIEKNNISMLICDDADLRISLLQSTSIEIVSMDTLRVIIEESDPIKEDEFNDFIEKPIDPDKPCCIFLTSGTSGDRKAVVLSHGNIAEDINGSCRLFCLNGDTYAVLPFHHAFGLVVAVLMVLNYRKTVYIGSGLRHIRQELLIAKPQTMMLVPLFVENFHKQIWDTVKQGGKENKLRWAMRLSDMLMRLGIDIRRRLFHEVLAPFGGNLEYIICGGASLDVRFVKEFRSFGIEILNGYGTTECSPVVAVNRNCYHRDGSVGQSLPGSEIQISDDGEVLVRGDHVMMGYYGNEEETRAVLKNGWYATGDLGAVDKDGFLFLFGRKKNLIVLSNGENVSPEELEERVRQIDGVDEVVVSGENGKIVAEIYSEEVHNCDGTNEVRQRIDASVTVMNKTLPVYKRIVKTRFRDTPFEKTTTRKIKRREA